MIEDENLHSRVICDLFLNPKNMRHAKVAWKRLEGNTNKERRGIRRGQMARAFPTHLAMNIAPFSEWLHEYVHMSLDCNEPLNENIICLSQPPSRIVKSYASMWAYGNHYRVEGEIGDCHMTYDSGIACIFIQGRHLSARDRNVITTNLYYVGVLNEILVVSYATMKRILFCASWIPSNLRGV
jgi:hypothetical protein